MIKGRVDPMALFKLTVNDRVRKPPGVSAVVSKGSFLGVVAVRKEQARAAMQLLRETSRWTEDGPRLSQLASLPDELRKIRQGGISSLRKRGKTMRLAMFINGSRQVTATPI
jgi:hypothetical protein